MYRVAIIVIACTACGRIGFDGLTLGEPAVPRTLAAGGDFTCALRGSDLFCWGANASGQIGDGTSERRPTPTRVALADVVEVEAGSAHACARDIVGDVYCWGDNAFRQIGDRTTDNAKMPTRVAGLPRPAVDIGLGQDHSCAVLDDGDLWCWGSNGMGECGTGTSSIGDTNDPERARIDHVAEIDGGGGQTCARRNGTDLWCWGNDYYDEAFGVGGVYGGSTPGNTGVDVTTLTAGGTASCGIRLDSRFVCSGYGYSGNLGGTNRNMPSAPGYSAISMGSGHGCALTTGGDVHCWGLADRGQLGYGGESGYRETLATALLAEPAVEISAGVNHTCARLASGAIQCWGSGRAGQLGDGRAAERVPVRVPVPVPNASIGVGGEMSCSVDTVGGVWCWGYDPLTGATHSMPTQMTGIPAAGGRVALGANFGCVRAGGEAWCWGQNHYNQLGANDGPTAGLAFAGVPIDLVAGEFFTCGIAADYSVWCWGLPDYVGPSGDGSPWQKVGMAGDLAAGSTHACMRMLDGTVECFGHNGHGQLGPRPDGETPMTVPGVSGVNFVIGGSVHTCALVGNTLSCWGNDGTSRGIRTDPEVVSTTVSAGGGGLKASCVVMMDNTVHCWGNNTYGQLGDGTNVRRDDPTPVGGSLPATATDTDVASSHACALVGTDIYCWGDNDKGQLGIGTQTRSLVPITIPIP